MDFYQKNAEFRPIIHFYGRLLAYPGSINDLWEFLFFLQAKYGDNFPPAYYKKAIKNEYIRLSKIETQARILLTELLDFSAARFENSLENQLLLEKAFDFLTEKECSVLRRHFAIGYSLQEIARQDNCTRQAVFRTKSRALNKLRDFMLLDKIRP